MLQMFLHQLELCSSDLEFFKVKFLTVNFIKHLTLFSFKRFKVSLHSLKIHCLLVHKLLQQVVDLRLGGTWEIIDYFPRLISELTETTQLTLC